MNRNKYLVGAIGLAVGFIVSFFWTQSVNKSSAGAPPGAQSSAMPGGAGGQQAMMGQVQQTIDKAKANPNDFQAQFDAARVYYQIGRSDEAVEYLKKAYAINPTDFASKPELQGALEYIAEYYSDKKNYPEAEKWYASLIQGNPNNAEAYVELGVTFTQREPPNPDRAIQEIQRALKIEPKNAHALGHLVEAYALKKDAQGAEEALTRLKEAEPANPRITSLQNMLSDLKAGKPITIPKE